MLCTECIFVEVCKFFPGSEPCDFYRGTCKDCDNYMKNPITEVWGCAATSTSMPEYGYCDLWELRKCHDE